MSNAFTSTACSSSPCLHDGTCILDSSHTYHCACLGGYTGKNCEHGEFQTGSNQRMLFICGGLKCLFETAAHKLLSGQVLLFGNRNHLVTTKPSLAGLLYHWCITKGLGLAVTRLMSVVWMPLKPAACLSLPCSLVLVGQLV